MAIEARVITKEGFDIIGMKRLMTNQHNIVAEIYDDREMFRVNSVNESGTF